MTFDILAERTIEASEVGQKLVTKDVHHKILNIFEVNLNT